MSKIKKILEKAKASPSNISFEDLCYLVVKFGYVFDRKVGSHVIYKHPRIQSRLGALVNIQEFENGKAKCYQVREVLRFIEEFGLEQEGE